jgi:hypothetical protein
VIEYETKAPIEGAVVGAMYFIHPIVGMDGGGYPVHIKEILTDKEGKFVFPSYLTWIFPLQVGDHIGFYFYKPGYVSRYFWDKEFLSYFGGKVLEGSPLWNESKKVRFHDGILELSRLESKEDRINALRDTNLYFGQKKEKLLLKLTNEESNYLYGPGAAIPNLREKK